LRRDRRTALGPCAAPRGPPWGRASSRSGFRSNVGASLLQSHFGFGVPQLFENGDTMFVIERPRRSDGNAAAAIGKPNAKARSIALTRRPTAGVEEPNVSATAEMPPASIPSLHQDEPRIGQCRWGGWEAEWIRSNRPGTGWGRESLRLNFLRTGRALSAQLRRPHRRSQCPVNVDANRPECASTGHLKTHGERVKSTPECQFRLLES
jgi:hypothetical protein